MLETKAVDSSCTNAHIILIFIVNMRLIPNFNFLLHFYRYKKYNTDPQFIEKKSPFLELILIILREKMKLVVLKITLTPNLLRRNSLLLKIILIILIKKKDKTNIFENNTDPQFIEKKSPLF